MGSASAGSAQGPSLLCRVGTSVCALAVGSVDEIMRPLPVDRVARGPSFVAGLSVIRGEAIPVVVLAELLGEADSTAFSAASTRFVTLRVGARRVALVVDAVLGVRTLSQAGVSDLPPLFREQTAGLISQVGTLDAELLLVLRAAQLVPDEVWTALEAAAS
jgi:purine-binding chemotaxis protein CheW